MSNSSVPSPEGVPQAVPAGQPIQPGQQVVYQPVAGQPVAVQAVPGQAVYVQPVAAPQPAAEQEHVSAPGGLRPQNLPTRELQGDAEPLELKLYSHSNLYYWWPVWAVGFIMAALSYMWGQPYTIADKPERFYFGSDLGVIFFIVLFLVILITNVSMRGMVSGMVILGVILATVLLAYFGLWDRILGWFGQLRIHMNAGAYFWFSLLMFIAWALTVFVFDRMSYWLIKPGQITYERVLGAGSKSYDTEGMTLEKFQGDLFKNWLIGLGSGDLHIQTWGANRERIDVPNVLFVVSKVATIQRMIATRPEEFGRATVH